MKKYFALFAILFLTICLKAEYSIPNDERLPEDLAKATLKAHGGEKLVQVTSIILRGSVEVTAPGTTQTLPASFALVLEAERYRFDIQSGFFNFLQVFDGYNTSSSMPGVNLPPMNRVGLFMLPRIGEPGYRISVLPESFKKKNGFRVTSPDGYYSDFLIDEKTFRVKEFVSSYQFNGRTISTSVAIDKYREVEGVLVNEKFSQRLDLGQVTAYASFSAKEILINSEIADDVFTIN